MAIKSNTPNQYIGLEGTSFRKNSKLREENSSIVIEMPTNGVIAFI